MFAYLHDASKSLRKLAICQKLSSCRGRLNCMLLPVDGAVLSSNMGLMSDGPGLTGQVALYSNERLLCTT